MKRLFVWVLVLISTGVGAADWPQWRNDAQHTAYTPVALPAELDVQWSREFSPRRQAWPSPLNQYLMQYDRQFEPVVMDGIMVLAFNDAYKVVGIDVDTGKTRWTYFTDGPVRLAPALWQGRAYISCDDGFLHCINVKDGSKVWKFDAAPDRRHALGNRRVISMWPVRGGAVVEDGRVYFSSGIWPFMGVFLYCLDAETGKQIWINDYADANYRNQPHNSPAFAGIAPQGVFAVTDKYVLAAGARTVPGAFDKQTGKEVYYLFSENSKNHGGDFVAVGDGVHYVRARDADGNPVYQAWDNSTGKMDKGNVQPGVPVLAGGYVFSATNGMDSIVA
ncbi:MAG: PQQ-binding-like beta-propeller repeat protein, partial [Kiritimatiellales bacterium]|nr:PQQ-binding-like beta-propeller repeat protein [Kiritimatiellales bacterium]